MFWFCEWNQIAIKSKSEPCPLPRRYHIPARYIYYITEFGPVASPSFCNNTTTTGYKWGDKLNPQYIGDASWCRQGRRWYSLLLNACVGELQLTLRYELSRWHYMRSTILHSGGWRYRVVLSRYDGQARNYFKDLVHLVGYVNSLIGAPMCRLIPS